jgi:hypothetical protein
MTDGNIKRSLKLTRVKTEGFKQKKTPVLLADSKGTYIENEITDPERFETKFINHSSTTLSGFDSLDYKALP